MLKYTVPYGLLFALTASALGSFVDVDVTPDNLKHGNYTFAVRTNTQSDSVTFHITINSKAEDISTRYCHVGVVNDKHTKHSVYTTETEPPIPITVLTNKHVWTADFITPKQFLKGPNIYFIFSEVWHTKTGDGKELSMPSVMYYRLKLIDFLQNNPEFPVVMVEGEVAQPGRVPWTNGMTLLDSIDAAGGLNEDATRRLLLIHPDNSRETCTLGGGGN